jgi:hypothetical protein
MRIYCLAGFHVHRQVPFRLWVDTGGTPQLPVPAVGAAIFGMLEVQVDHQG